MEEILIDVGEFLKNEDIEMSKDEIEAVEELYNTIYNKDISSKNILTYVILLMKIMDSYKTIEKVNKKKLVIFVITKFIEYNITDYNESKMLSAFVEKLLPNLIDTICKIDKGEILIKNKLTGCLF